MELREELLSILRNRDLSFLEKEKRVSSILSFYPNETEAKISGENPDLYAGLEDQALSTPFSDYFSILSDLPEGGELVDLGAGYGKGTLLANALGAGHCLSLELSQERLNYSRGLAAKAGIKAEGLEHFDLLSQDIPLAQAYFVYLPLGPLVFHPLERLLKAGHSCDFYVVESHGDLLDFFYSLPKWFRPQKLLDSSARRHREGIHKFHFMPERLLVDDLNSTDFYYYLVQNWSSNPMVVLEKESGRVEVETKSLLPIKYNEKMVLECLKVKRIVDFKQVKIVSA